MHSMETRFREITASDLLGKVFTKYAHRQLQSPSFIGLWVLLLDDSFPCLPADGTLTGPLRKNYFLTFELIKHCFGLMLGSSLPPVVISRQTVLWVL